MNIAMRLWRGLCVSGVVVAWTVALSPVLALFPAALLDEGPSGTVRPTVFPAALAALDPYTWDCVRNTLVMAVLVTFAARVVGVGLARIVTRWRFWGRSPLAALSCGALVVPPAFAALGLQWVFGSDCSGVEPSGWSAPLAWTEWFWVEFSAGAALVGLASASALRCTDPLWEDAARLEGASSARIWQKLLWPVIRPEVARALGVVFSLTLLDPGAPIVLGIRRTLGFQIVFSALDGGPGQLTRAVLLALGGAFLASFGRLLIGWAGGAHETNGRVLRVSGSEMPAQPASLRRALTFSLLLAVSACAVWTPVIGLFGAAMTRSTRRASASEGFLAILGDPLTQGYLIHSCLLGLTVVALSIAIARAVASWHGPGPGRTARVAERLAGLPEMFPPIVIGVGALALPRVIDLIASAGGTSGSNTTISETVRLLIDLLDTDRTPGPALVLAVTLTQLTLLTRSALTRKRQSRRVLIEVAQCLGATPRQARGTLSGRWLGAAPGVALLAFALAATNPVPHLVLCPTAESRSIGPAVLTLSDEPGGGRSRAAALASIAIAVNLVSLAVAARQRSGLPLQWLRG
jgi:iron(III) transport system permease protein